MKILIDMNLSPEWVQEFKENNIEAAHWSDVGKYNAPDTEIMAWAKKNDHVVFTHDLDFGTALALTHAVKPSVIQVRTQNVTVAHLSNKVVQVISEQSELLIQGALIVIDEDKQRIRILPLESQAK